MPVVIPELVYIVGLFFAIVGYMAARGLLASWTHTLGFVFEWLGSHLQFRIKIRGLPDPRVDLGGPFRAVDRAVISAIQVWCDGAEIEMGYCLHGLEKVGRYMAQAIDYLGRETAETFDWLVKVHLPKWAKYALLPLLIPLLVPKLIAAVLPHIRSNTVKTVHTVTHEVTHTVTRVVRAAVGGAVAFPPWVIRLPRRVGRVEGEVGRLARRLHRVEGFAAAAVFAGLLANVLGVATRCVRRGNLGKTARRVCGMDANLLDGLLLDALAIVGVISVVEFAEGLLAIEDEAVAILTAGIREFPG